MKNLLVLFLNFLVTVSIGTTAKAQSAITIDMGDKQSVVRSGTIKGEQYIDYKVKLAVGTQTNVLLNSNNKSNYFNVLPPASTEIAVYNSSINGNTYSGIAEQEGMYTVRIYLNRNAARRNETAKFTLTIKISGELKLVQDTGTGDKIISKGTGLILYTAGKNDSKMVNFKVNRFNGGKASIVISPPGNVETQLLFESGNWKCKAENCKLKVTKQGDNWSILINDYEKIIIPDAVVYGG